MPSSCIRIHPGLNAFMPHVQHHIKGKKAIILNERNKSPQMTDQTVWDIMVRQ